MALLDSHGRKINYLRLSVTDRCNFRCRYCMPPSGVAKLNHGEVLSYEELYLAARAAASLGIEKIRVTGGEPLVRKGILPFLRRLAAIDGVRQLVLTTNGHLLPEMAGALKDAGVQRLNISLDSLDEDNFSRITRGGDLRRVLSGIAAAEEAGMAVKINMVVMKGINDHELEAFAGLSLDKPRAVRFIEYMPAIREEGWQDLALSGRKVLEELGERYRFRSVSGDELSGPAREYRIDGAAGTIGVITAVSGHFCASCNRIRIASTGKARSCLFSNREMDLRPYLRTADLASVRLALRDLVNGKPAMHQLSADHAEHTPFSMAEFGG